MWDPLPEAFLCFVDLCLTNSVVFFLKIKLTTSRNTQPREKMSAALWSDFASACLEDCWEIDNGGGGGARPGLLGRGLGWIAFLDQMVSNFVGEVVDERDEYDILENRFCCESLPMEPFDDELLLLVDETADKGPPSEERLLSEDLTRLWPKKDLDADVDEVGDSCGSLLEVV
jgi:hypothetical protein